MQKEELTRKLNRQLQLQWLKEKVKVTTRLNSDLLDELLKQTSSIYNGSLNGLMADEFG